MTTYQSTIPTPRPRNLSGTNNNGQQQIRMDLNGNANTMTMPSSQLPQQQHQPTINRVLTTTTVNRNQELAMAPNQQNHQRLGHKPNESGNEEAMPLTVTLAYKLMAKVAELRRNGIFPWAMSDGKSQVTVEYKHVNGVAIPKRVHTIMLMCQHTSDITVDQLRHEILEKVIKAVIPSKYLDSKTIFNINPVDNQVAVVNRTVTKTESVLKTKLEPNGPRPSLPKPSVKIRKPEIPKSFSVAKLEPIQNKFVRKQPIEMNGNVNGAIKESPSNELEEEARDWPHPSMPTQNVMLMEDEMRSIQKQTKEVKTLLYRLQCLLQNAESLNPFDNQSKDVYQSAFQNLVCDEQANTDMTNGFSLLDSSLNELRNENLDLKRQMKLYRQELLDRDNTIRSLQHQLKSLTINNITKPIPNGILHGSNKSVAATQTDRCHDLSGKSGRNLSDGSDGMLVSSCDSCEQCTEKDENSSFEEIKC